MEEVLKGSVEPTLRDIRDTQEEITGAKGSVEASIHDTRDTKTNSFKVCTLFTTPINDKKALSNVGRKVI